MINWNKEYNKIKNMVLNGKTIREIGEIYNVSFQAISSGMKKNNLSIREIGNKRTADRKAVIAEKKILIEAKKELKRRDDFYKKYSDISNYRPSKRGYNSTKVSSMDPKDIANRERQAAYRKDNYIKVLSRRIIAYAIDRKYIIQQPCSVCGTLEKIEYHHSDYTKPLDVICLCKEHHHAIHSGEKWHSDRKVSK